MTKYYVTIKNSEETMLGGVSASEVATTNIDASMAEYERLMRVELEGVYDAEYTFEYGPFGGPSIIVLLDEPWNEEDCDEAEELSNWVQAVGERVFEAGKFWVAYTPIQLAAAALGKIGGASRSEAKQAASRINGTKGGRPKKS